MDSELSFRYAFIEHFDYDEDKYQTTSNASEFDELKLLNDELLNDDEVLVWDKIENAFIIRDKNDFYFKKTDKHKIFNIDINKCRKNELYYSKYDFS